MIKGSKIFDATSIGPALKAVRLATAAALPAVTASGTGVGKTLTADANGVLTVDGVAPEEDDRLLIKDQVDAADNGAYSLTTVGDESTAFVLTRTTDYDAASASEITKGSGFLVSAGTANAGTSWILTTDGAITVDTTDLDFDQGGGDNDVVNSTPLVISRAVGVGMTVEVTETLAPLVGTLKFRVANGNDRDRGRGVLPWTDYASVGVSGTGVTVDGDGVITVSGAVDFTVSLIDMDFDYLDAQWDGTTGDGTITMIATAKGRS